MPNSAGCRTARHAKRRGARRAPSTLSHRVSLLWSFQYSNRRQTDVHLAPRPRARERRSFYSAPAAGSGVPTLCSGDSHSPLWSQCARFRKCTPRPLNPRRLHHGHQRCQATAAYRSRCVFAISRQSLPQLFGVRRCGSDDLWLLAARARRLFPAHCRVRVRGARERILGVGSRRDAQTAKQPRSGWTGTDRRRVGVGPSFGVRAARANMVDAVVDARCGRRPTQGSPEEHFRPELRRHRRSCVGRGGPRWHFRRRRCARIA
jgi:hypothetical protein